MYYIGNASLIISSFCENQNETKCPYTNQKKKN